MDERDMNTEQKAPIPEEHLDETRRMDPIPALENHSPEEEGGTEPNRSAEPARKRRNPWEEDLHNQFPNFFYSGFFIRFFAFLIDSIVAEALARIVIDGLFRLISPNLGTQMPMLYQGGHLLVFLLYFTIFTYLTNGQTLGKMIFGLRVVSFKEERLSLITVLIRELVGRFIYSYSWLSLLYAAAAFTPKKQHIVDMLADTSVLTQSTVDAFQMDSTQWEYNAEHIQNQP